MMQEIEDLHKHYIDSDSDPDDNGDDDGRTSEDDFEEDPEEVLEGEVPQE
jgi:hypothetical protein